MCFIASQRIEPLHKQLLHESLITAGASEELMQYFVESFGSLQRIDYGTGWSDAYRLHAGVLPI